MLPWSSPTTTRPSSCLRWSRPPQPGSDGASKPSTATACCRWPRPIASSPPPTPFAASSSAPSRTTSRICPSRTLWRSPCLHRDRCPTPSLIDGRWPRTSILGGNDGALAALPIDHSVAPAPLRGGACGGRGSIAQLPAIEAPFVRRDSQPPRRGRSQRTLPLSPFRPHIRPPGISRAHDPGTMDARTTCHRAPTGAAAGGGACTRLGRGLPRPAHHLARTRLQPVLAPRRPRSLLGSSRVGPTHPRGACQRSPRAPLLGGGARNRRDSRPAVERCPAPARARRPNPQLPAHAVGQEDPRVESKHHSRR